MGTWKVSYFVWGEPAFSIVNANTESDAVEYIANEYNSDDSFSLREVERIDWNYGVKLTVFEP